MGLVPGEGQGRGWYGVSVRVGLVQVRVKSVAGTE